MAYLFREWLLDYVFIGNCSLVGHIFVKNSDIEKILLGRIQFYFWVNCIFILHGNVSVMKHTPC